jgi:chromosomal replication initiation ATPase DnaA
MNPGDAQVRRNKIEAIQRAVAHLFGLSVEELHQRSTRRTVTVPRQIASKITPALAPRDPPRLVLGLGWRGNVLGVNRLLFQLLGEL